MLDFATAAYNTDDYESEHTVTQWTDDDVLKNAFNLDLSAEAWYGTHTLVDVTLIE